MFCIKIRHEGTNLYEIFKRAKVHQFIKKVPSWEDYVALSVTGNDRKKNTKYHLGCQYKNKMM